MHTDAHAFTCRWQLEEQRRALDEDLRTTKVRLPCDFHLIAHATHTHTHRKTNRQTNTHTHTLSHPSHVSLCGVVQAEVLRLRAELEEASTALEGKLSAAPQFVNMRKMIETKNHQIKELRQQLSK